MTTKSSSSKSKKGPAKGSNAEKAQILRSAASALEHGRHSTANKKLAAIAPVHQRSDEVQELIAAARGVVAAWSEGDLAGAVNALEAAADNAEESRVFEVQLTEDESDALLEVLGRGQEDAANYLLTIHAKNDFGDEYADHLTTQADIFGQVASVLHKLKFPLVSGQWKEFAKILAEAAKEEAKDQ